MPDVKEVIANLHKMSTYYKSMMAVGSQEDMEIYTRHREIVNMAIELLGEQQNQITMMKMIYGDFGTVVGKLVRCKDCKHVCLCDAEEMFPDMPVYAKCTLTDETHEPEWYCADGEPK